MKKRITYYSVRVPHHIWAQIDDIKVKTGKSKERITEEVLIAGLREKKFV